MKSISFKNNLKKNTETIDLFCGIGGLTNGLIKSGLPVSKGFDIEPFFQYAYEKNNNAKFIHKDIKEITGEELFQKDKKIKILVGCAPCQPFSLYAAKYKYNESNNSNWSLLKDFFRLIEETAPDIVSLENVPNLKNQEVFKDFITNLENLEYHIFNKVVHCVDYGVPQSRKRLVVLASKLGKIELIEKTHPEAKVVQDVFKGLRKISAGEIDKKDFLHRSASLSDLNIERIKASKPGGSWKDWEYRLKLECHKKLSGNSFHNVYGRMDFQKPAPTITTQFWGYGSGRFGHPVENRAMSVREGALLQTFPKKYRFCKKKDFAMQKVCQAIGNAVPPELGKVIGKSIIRHLEEYEKRNVSV